MMNERRIELMPLEDIQGAARNPKDHDIGELSKSVGRFGFTEAPLLDERTGRLVAGHGRIETLRALQARPGSKPPEGVKVDANGRWLVPVLRGWASRSDRDAEARARMYRGRRGGSIEDAPGVHPGEGGSTPTPPLHPTEEGPLDG